MIVFIGLIHAAAAQPPLLERLQASEARFTEGHTASVALTRPAMPMHPSQGTVTFTGQAVASGGTLGLTADAQYERAPAWVEPGEGRFSTQEYRGGGLSVQLVHHLEALHAPEWRAELRESINHVVYPSGDVEDLEPPSSVIVHSLSAAVGVVELSYGWLALGRGIVPLLDVVRSEEPAGGLTTLTATGRFGAYAGVWELSVEDGAEPLIREAQFTVDQTPSPHIVVRTDGRAGAVAESGVLEIHTSAGVGYTLSASVGAFSDDADAAAIGALRARLEAAVEAADTVIDMRTSPATITHPGAQ